MATNISPPKLSTAERSTGWLQLALASVLIALAWGWVLPVLSRLPAQQRYERWLDEKRIDPSAMFYTELESFEPVLRRLENR